MLRYRNPPKEVVVPTLAMIAKENRWQDRLKAEAEQARVKREERRRIQLEEQNRAKKAEPTTEPETPLTFEQMQNQHILAHAQAMAGLRQTIKQGIYPLRDLQEDYFLG